MIYRSGSVQVDEQRLELHDGKHQIAVEPRVLETLIHLMRHHDRVVSREELVREVWRTAHVSDSAVSRCIMEARRALGDDGEDRRFIKTVHGRGYRFVAPVEIGPRKTSERRRVGIAGALGALALLASAAVALWIVSRQSESAPEESSSLVVVRSSVIGDDERLSWLALTTEDILRLALESSSLLRLAEPSDDGDDAVAPDAFLDAKFEPGPVDGFARIELDFRRAPEPGSLEATPLAHLVVPLLNPGRAPERFASIREVVAGMVAPRLEETVRRSRGSAPDHEAWQLYLRAVNQWEPTCEAAALINLVERSLELSPDFLPSLYVLGGIRLAQAKFCAGNPEAVPALEGLIDRIAAIAPNSSTPASLRVTLLLYQGSLEEAFELLTEAERRHGADDLALRIGRANALRYAGFLVASQKVFDEALAQYPALPYIAGLVPYPLRYQGEWDRFLALLPGFDSPHFRFYRGLAESAIGESERAGAVLEPAFDNHPGDLYGRLCQAQLAILRSDTEEARVLLRQLARQRADGGLDGEVTFEIGQLMVAAGDRDSGLEQLSAAVEQGFVCGACLESDAVLRPLAGTARFDDIVARARARQLAFAERFGLP